MALASHCIKIHSGAVPPLKNPKLPRLENAHYP